MVTKRKQVITFERELVRFYFSVLCMWERMREKGKKNRETRERKKGEVRGKETRPFVLYFPTQSSQAVLPSAIKSQEAICHMHSHRDDFFRRQPWIPVPALRLSAAHLVALKEMSWQNSKMTEDSIFSRF